MDKKKISKASGIKETYIQLIAFKLGQETFGIRIQQVKEVTLTPSVSRVPKAPAFILGVANIRGDIMAIMDLEKRMGITRKSNLSLQKNPPKYTLVIENDEYSIGLTVEEVPVSITIAASSIDKAPDIIRETQINKDYLEGIAKTGNDLVIILDINNMLTFKEVRKIASL